MLAQAALPATFAVRVDERSVPSRSCTAWTLRVGCHATCQSQLTSARLLRHIRTTRDGDFSRERFSEAYNAELANGLGNLTDRVLGLLQRSHAGRVPPAGDGSSPAVNELRTAALALPAAVDRACQAFALDEALAAIFSVIDLANRSLAEGASLPSALHLFPRYTPLAAQHDQHAGQEDVAE